MKNTFYLNLAQTILIWPQKGAKVTKVKILYL